MGYSKNPAAVERVKPLLDQMVKATTDLMWPSENAHMLGYHLREAMSVAKSKKIEPYHELKDKFVIRNRGTRVIAEKRHVETITALQAALSKVVLSNIETLVQIVGAAIEHKAHELFFPDAALAVEEDKLTLYKWCQKNGYHMILAEVGVTLTKEEVGDIEWTPE